MIVGTVRLELFIPESDSLKAKRMVMNSLKARLRNNFNVSLALVGDTRDTWQRASLAVVNVGIDTASVNSTLSSVVNYVERFARVELLDYRIELG